MLTVKTRQYLEPAQARQFPALHGLLATIHDTPDVHAPEVISTWQNDFDAFLRSDEPVRILVSILDEVRDDDALQCPWLSTVSEEWLVADDERFCLRVVGVKPSQSVTISSLSHDCLLGNLAQAPLQLLRHRFPAGIDLERFVRGAVLEHGEQELLCSRASSALLAHKDVPAYALELPAPLIQLFPRSYAPLVWMFDRQTLAAQLPIASSERPVRLQVVADILQHLLCGEALPVAESLETLARLSRYADHYVRWSALRGLCAIDFEYAAPYLLEACRDPHPAVAAAAQQAARRFLAARGAS